MAEHKFDIADYIKPARTSNLEYASTENDRFLLDEGLDLLASYRSIPDAGLRLAVKRLVDQVAALARPEGREV